MMKKSILFVGALALLGSGMTAYAADSGVRYEGDRTAKSVCMSITKDDVSTMKNSLRRAARFSPIPLNKIHKYYTCNDLALIDFAYEWKATNTIGYLESRGERRGSVTMEEVASR